ncbi:hypothetical protein [Amycolatopsis sp. FDAARGOS 1241]|uniref:hypothetical protein n=1 Tax=Amycolatopsis sp. FDAARGOS 1241 TaxID=2778070 RepID=UPI001951867C|nr:hypothetical protein [Amycolatopsis sp. FDAARGOS 1241]QRP49169.1 hypothetical protein I6J71_16125 [Amycolatopsis sp. FDAARGOS 1241]
MDSVDLTGIAEPHMSTVFAILGYARQGRFTEAEAHRMIDRLRGLSSHDGPQRTAEPTEHPGGGTMPAPREPS